MLLTILTLKLISILSTTLKIKAYRNYIKRILITLKYKYLKTLTGPQLKNLNNYFNVMEYGSLIKRVSQYYKHCIILLMRITVWNN